MKRIPITVLIMILVGSGYIVGQVLELLNPYYLLFLVQYNPLIIYYHFYWELITSILITPSFIDFGFNEIALYIMYYLFRSKEGVVEIAIFFITGVFGNLLYLLVYPNGLPSAGASGGIFGLLSFYAVYEYLKKNEKGGLILLIVALILSDFIPFLQVNVLAHIGGTIGGLLFSLLLFKVRHEQRSII
ncbi:rhomboid family intramembrane serine protease [Stygiolobus sp. CP850M]|uniref:rhomboid family intramembrane serine protease n=1 Tax=Stygiolobus sp. CP850M TaxID=3133134 RepID=UPI00307FC9B6